MDSGEVIEASLEPEKHDPKTSEAARTTGDPIVGRIIGDEMGVDCPAPWLAADAILICRSRWSAFLNLSCSLVATARLLYILFATSRKLPSSVISASNTPDL